MGKYTGILAEAAVPMDSTNYMPIAKRAPVTAQIVIGTPGTIKKWMSLKKLGANYIKILVFDEADHMLAEVVSLQNYLVVLCWLLFIFLSLVAILTPLVAILLISFGVY